MFFEDEKDINENTPDIEIVEDDDTSVSWESILDDANDETDLVSIKNDASPEITKAVESTPAPSEVELGNDLELLEDVSLDDDDDVSDDDLAKILGTDDSIDEPSVEPSRSGIEGDLVSEAEVEDKPSVIEDEDDILPTPTETYISPEDEYFVSEIPDDEFDIDKQLDSIDLDSEATQAALAALDAEDDSLNGDVSENPDADDIGEIVTPKEEDNKKKSSNLRILILLAILVAALAFFFLSNKSRDEEVPPMPQQDDVVNPVNTDVQNQNIPVVSEDEVDKLKAEEKEKKEKVTIAPTGRLNPFLPMKKYIAIDNPDIKYDYDAAGIPKPPAEYAVADPEANKMLNIMVSGIMYDSVKPSAIITLDDSDYFVQIGDKLDNYRVVDIGRNYVKIAYGKNVYKANVGEEFKIGPEFYGNAQFQRNGAKMYHTVGGEEEKPKSLSTQRYTSEADVKVRGR